MSLTFKQILIASLAILFLTSLLFVQWAEVSRKQEEAGLVAHHVAVPEASKNCVECHRNSTPGIIDHWIGSTHAAKGVGCVECHKANEGEPDAFSHYGQSIATIVTPQDCGRCHVRESAEFASSHHAKGGQILASLDNRLAEVVEGAKIPFNPHSATPGHPAANVNGMAFVDVGCKQCHGSKVALVAEDGSLITADQLKPGKDGKPEGSDAGVKEALSKIKKINGKPILHASTWPNTGIGRINLDGSLGSCSACHSRHDFSPRRARQPENCGKCHLGPDHPQKEIYEESKHGVAFRDLKDQMHLDAKHWVLGVDYSQAPTCATCHMSGNKLNGGKVTHDPGTRISWTNRPAVSLPMDTDANGKVVTELDPTKREALIVHKAEDRRAEMKQVCMHCHTPDYIGNFYKQYDDFVITYNEKFAKPGLKIVKALRDQKLLTPAEFDEEIEWTWYLLWHHEGRRARHGASMMAPDYAHWHGTFEVAERFYVHFIPEARELADRAEKEGNKAGAEAVRKEIQAVLDRPEHQWFEAEKKKRAEGAAATSASPPVASTTPAVAAPARPQPPVAPDEPPPAKPGDDKKD